MCEEKALMSLTHIIKTFEHNADVRQIKTLLSKHFLNNFMESSLRQCPRQFQHPDKNWTLPNLSETGRPKTAGGLSDTHSALLGVLKYVSDSFDTFTNPVCLYTSLSLKKCAFGRNPGTRTSVPRHGSRGSSGSCETSRSRPTKRELQMDTIWPKASSTNT